MTSFCIRKKIKLLTVTSNTSLPVFLIDVCMLSLCLVLYRGLFFFLFSRYIQLLFFLGLCLLVLMHGRLQKRQDSNIKCHNSRDTLPAGSSATQYLIINMTVMVLCLLTLSSHIEKVCFL